MRKFLFLPIFILFVFMGCSNLTTPKRIEVSTGASLKLALGKIEVNKDSIDFSQIFSAEKLTDKLRNDMGSSVALYNYTANEESNKALTYLLRYPLYSVPLNIGDYFKQMNISETLNSSEYGTSFELVFDLPSISLSDKDTVLDISSVKDSFLDNIEEDLNSQGFDTETIIEPGYGESENILQYMNGHTEILITSEHASAVEYSEQSKILFKVTKLDTALCGEDYHFRMNAYICNTSNEPIPGHSSGYTDVSRGGILAIPYAGELPGEIKIKFEGEVTGGIHDSNHEHFYRIDFAMNDEFDIVKVKDVTAEPEDIGIVVNPIDQEIDVGEGMIDKFTSAIIDDGVVFIQTNQPENWSGVTCSSSIYLEGAGFARTQIPDDSSKTASDFIKKKLSLEGYDFHPSAGDSKIRIKGNIDLVIEHATFNFESNTTKTIETDVQCYVNSLKTATVKFVDENGNKNAAYSDFPLPYTYKEKASKELLQYVRKIYFSSQKHNQKGEEIEGDEGKSNGLSISCTYKNTFPEGNNIPVSFSSKFFNFDTGNSEKTEKVSYLAYETVNGKDEMWRNFPTVEVPLNDDLNPPEIDVVVSIPNNQIDLENLRLGTVYTISMNNLSFDFDWDKIDFDASSETVSDKVQIGALDITDTITSNPMFEGQNIKLNDVNAYIFTQCDESSPLYDSGLKGFVNLEYTSPEGAVERKEIIPDGEIKYNAPVNWPELGKDFTTSVDKLDYTQKISLTDILNNKPQDVSVVYEMAMATQEKTYMTIYSTDMPDNKNQNISIEMAIVLPIDITLGEALEFDLMNMLDEEWEDNPKKDLLGRNPPDTKENPGEVPQNSSMNLAEYAGYLKAFKMILTINNNLFHVTDNAGKSAFEIIITDECLKNPDGTYESLVTNEGNRFIIEFSPDKIKAISDSAVFHPSIKFRVGAENAHFAINKDAVASSEEIPDEEAEEESLLSVNVILQADLNPDNPFVIEM